MAELVVVSKSHHNEKVETVTKEDMGHKKDQSFFDG